MIKSKIVTILIKTNTSFVNLSWHQCLYSLLYQENDVLCDMDCSGSFSLQVFQILSPIFLLFLVMGTNFSSLLRFRNRDIFSRINAGTFHRLLLCTLLSLTSSLNHHWAVKKGCEKTHSPLIGTLLTSHWHWYCNFRVRDKF